MTTALVESIALIDEILKACEDPSTFQKSATEGHSGAPPGPKPADGAPKQGKKEKKKKAAKPVESASSAPATQDPMASADLRVRVMALPECVQSH